MNKNWDTDLLTSKSTFEIQYNLLFPDIDDAVM